MKSLPLTPLMDFLSVSLPRDLPEKFPVNIYQLQCPVKKQGFFSFFTILSLLPIGSLSEKYAYC